MEGWPLEAGMVPKGHEERLQAGPRGRWTPAPGSGALGGRLVLENRVRQVSSRGVRETEEGGRRKRLTVLSSHLLSCPPPAQAGGGWPLTRPHCPWGAADEASLGRCVWPQDGEFTPGTLHGPEPWVSQGPLTSFWFPPCERYHNPGASLGSSLWGRLERLSRAAQQGEPPPSPGVSAGPRAPTVVAILPSDDCRATAPPPLPGDGVPALTVP